MASLYVGIRTLSITLTRRLVIPRLIDDLAQRLQHCKPDEGIMKTIEHLVHRRKAGRARWPASQRRHWAEHASDVVDRDKHDLSPICHRLGDGRFIVVDKRTSAFRKLAARQVGLARAGRILDNEPGCGFVAM
jgi:hypothetical protein